MSTTSTLSVTEHSDEKPRFLSETLSQTTASESAEELELHVTNGQRTHAVTGHDGTDHVVAELDGYAIDLTVTAIKPAVAHGEDGLVRFPLGHDTYYSRTRLSVGGTLTVGDRAETVTGIAWFDHQWGVPPTVGWEWFAVQLDDGRDLMVYARRAPGLFGETIDATLADAECGEASRFDARGVRVSRLASWTSPDTGVEYGADWQLEIPSEGLELRVTPRVPGSEIRSDSAWGLPYVFADSDVVGTQHGQPLRGLAFVEQSVL